MKAREYLSIISEAVHKEFGCLLPVGKSYTKKLCFSFDDERIEYDLKKHLVDKAIRCINNGVDFPPGIYLTRCNIIID